MKALQRRLFRGKSHFTLGRRFQAFQFDSTLSLRISISFLLFEQQLNKNATLEPHLNAWIVLTTVNQKKTNYFVRNLRLGSLMALEHILAHAIQLPAVHVLISLCYQNSPRKLIFSGTRRRELPVKNRQLFPPDMAEGVSSKDFVYCTQKTSTR